MNFEEGRASSAACKNSACKNKVMLGGGLSCVLLLTLFSWHPFNERITNIEQNCSAALKRIKQRITKQDWQTKVYAQTINQVAADHIIDENKIIDASHSDIYPKLEKARIELAKQARLDANQVWLSCLNKESGDIAVVALSKQSLRTRGAAQQINIDGTPATLTVDEANGVNTKVSINSEKNWIPLTFAYPIDRGGLRIAYYTPAHYQLRSQALVEDGRAYIHNHVFAATTELSKAGYQVSGTAREMAGKLSIVEHVDHGRFVNESPKNLFEEIYTLYALNRGETYKYSISVAGAGGMIQMIPSTFKMIRQLFPAAGLGQDFAAAMSDHHAAMKSMLLYLNLTYDNYLANNVVASAITNTTARVNDLMAAGYNSNPARIPSYLGRNNERWTQALPRETNIYLSILHTLENPDEPQVATAREFLYRPAASFHTAKVSLRSVGRSSRYHVQVAAHSNRNRYHKRSR